MIKISEGEVRGLSPFEISEKRKIMKTMILLGSTGSIGTQSLEVAKKYGISIKALAANSNYRLLAKQADMFGVKILCMYDEKSAEKLREIVPEDVKILTGMEGLKETATLDGADIVLNSVVGMVGLEPTLAAIEKGRDIALANKETLVTGGKLVMNTAREKGVKILPVDSEHSAIFQSLQGNKGNKIKSIILTASGGPFFEKKKSELENITLSQALNHPNWSMGKKITVDSATLMNKGLEFIEAMWLFGVSPEQINIVVHRQSVVHSAVEFEDNSVIAQLGTPDMKIPIQYALLYPHRKECDVGRLSLTDYGNLTFEKPDTQVFECLKYCIESAKTGGTAPTIVNGANEVAVAAFIENKIKFLDIGKIVGKALDEIPHKEVNSLEDILEADRNAREFANRIIEKQK